VKRIESVRKVALGAGYVAVVGCMGACKNKAAKTKEPAKAGAEPKSKSATGFNIDLNEPKYADLEKPGAYVYVGKLIIARTNDGELVAYPKKCTHEGGPLSYDIKSGLFVCPWHGTQYSGKGEVVRGPAKVNLKVYNVAKENSTLTITPKG